MVIPSHKGGHPHIIENKFLIELEALDVEKVNNFIFYQQDE